jgi:hypothetical protein
MSITKRGTHLYAGNRTGSTGSRWGSGVRSRPTVALLAAVSMVALGTVAAQAQGGGGTAKPPKGIVSPWVIPTLGSPVWTGTVADLHGFDDTGLLRSATVSNRDCPTITDPASFGGTVVLNGVQITIPCNLIVQMPANTLSWASFVKGSGTSGDVPDDGLELRAVGNMVGARHIAGLAFASQQSANTGTGVVAGFDYTNGSMKITNPGGGTVTVQINDPAVPGLLDSHGQPTGRFSAGQSPDPRFSVDQENPTIHAATGFPMCVPRTDPTLAGGDDPLCPQANRPALKPVTVNAVSVPAVTSCRSFSVAGVALPASGELSAPATGQTYCSQYVMPDPAVNTVGGNARQQAPFEVGDFVSYSGTLITPSAGAEYVSAHTIEANVGIYTQPGTKPSYLAIGEFGVGTADPLATAPNGAAQETQDRIFLEAETSDVKTPVDIYYEDASNSKDAAGVITTSVRNRWTTPFEMTGENAAPLTGPTGGITTQNTGPQPQRARLRATKAPGGLLSQPSRVVRVAARTLCTPTPLDPTVTTINQATLDACFANAPMVANGLKAGQYAAPVFEYIFPENVRPGDVPVPNDLWHLPFLRSDASTAAIPTSNRNNPEALVPAPW